MRSEVLVVGAGPTGLVVAAELVKYGVSVRIIENDTAHSKHSKALSVTPATLKLFHGLGVTEKYIASGKKVSSAKIYFNKKKTAHINLGKVKSPYNYYLSIPQPETEKNLENLLNSKGVFVEYKKEFVDAKQNETGVCVTEKCMSTGELSESRYDYLIGCDGARSKVRNTLSLPFEGKDYGMHFVMSDVIFQENLDINETTYYISENDFMIVLPMQNGLIRLVVKKNGFLPTKKLTLTIDEMQAYVDRLYPKPLTIKDVVWSSGAQFFHRVASTNHIGRVFLAGDSFHLFSPIGGQGMNTGVQDAFNLAWKLSLFIKKQATLQLLSSYQTERFFAVKKLLDSTSLNTDLISDSNCLDPKRNYFIPSFKNRNYYRYTMPGEFSGLQSDYAQNETSLEGRHVPFIMLENLISDVASTYDLPKLGKNILFLTVDFCDSKRDFLNGDNYENVLLKLVISQKYRKIIDQLALSDNRCCLVRPDGFIGYHGTFDGLLEYLIINYMECKNEKI